MLLYGTVIPRPSWALDPDSTVWPMASTSFFLRPPAQAHKSHYPRPHIARKPKEWIISISTHPLPSPGHCSANHIALRDTISCMSGNTLLNISAKHIYWNGNHFQSHSDHTPLPPKHPLTINDIGPPIALTLEVIIVSPLIIRL